MSISFIIFYLRIDKFSDSIIKAIAMPTLKAIYRYPVKSLRGESLEKVSLTNSGIAYDRHWMIVDEEFQFMTQRQYPDMSQIKASVADGGCTLSHKSDKIEFDINQITHTQIPTKVWAHEVIAQIVSEEVSDWLSNRIGQRVHLVGAGGAFWRVKQKKQRELALKFQDGYPLLVLSHASVDQLNGQLQHAVSADRFRTNLYINNCLSHEEDLHHGLANQNYQLKLESQCKRCIMVNTDQETGQVTKEPLKTLATYRRSDSNVYFGMNASVLTAGEVRLGDKLEFI